jgi:hypothetical protein
MLIGEQFVPAPVMDRLCGDCAVVVLVPGSAATTRVEEVKDDEALVVPVSVAVTTDELAARRQLRLESGSRTDHASPIDVEGI